MAIQLTQRRCAFFKDDSKDSNQKLSKGINLRIKKVDKTLELEAIDSDSEKKWFEASMIHADSDPASWIVNAMGGAMANTKYGNMRHSERVKCLVTRGEC